MYKVDNITNLRKRVVYGTPINPTHLADQLAGSSFCISYWSRKKLGKQLDQIINMVGDDEILLVDNGAFSAWMAGETMDDAYWDGFASWASDIMKRCPQAVVVVPDVIDGDGHANDEMISRFTACDLELDGVDLEWNRLMVVWHMHEPISRLTNLIEAGFQYIAIGSSGEYSKPNTPEWHARIQEAFAAMDALVATGAYHRPWVHMMRAQAQAHLYPFDSSDSTNVAVNHSRYKSLGDGYLRKFADRVASKIELSCNMRDRMDTPAQLAYYLEGDVA